MAVKLAYRDTRGFSKEIRSTKVTYSKLPHVVYEIEGECEFEEILQHQLRYRLNCIDNS